MADGTGGSETSSGGSPSGTGAAAGSGAAAGGPAGPAGVGNGGAAGARPDENPGPVEVPLPTPDECFVDVSPGERTVACDGLNVDISVPSQCLTYQCGLIADVHGATMSGLIEDMNTSMRELGRQHGYIVLQRNAPEPWRGGQRGAAGEAHPRSTCAKA